LAEPKNLKNILAYSATFFSEHLSDSDILTFPVILAIPSLSCERSAEEKLPAASERRKC